MGDFNYPVIDWITRIVNPGAILKRLIDFWIVWTIFLSLNMLPSLYCGVMAA